MCQETTFGMMAKIPKRPREGSQLKNESGAKEIEKNDNTLPGLANSETRRPRLNATPTSVWVARCFSVFYFDVLLQHVDWNAGNDLNLLWHKKMATNKQGETFTIVRGFCTGGLRPNADGERIALGVSVLGLAWMENVISRKPYPSSHHICWKLLSKEREAELGRTNFENLQASTARLLEFSKGRSGVLLFLSLLSFRTLVIR